MACRKNSGWSDENETKCLLILKKLENEGFPRGRQIELCRELSRTTKLSEGSISAKVCNYKSVAGINNKSHPSTATFETYEKYKRLNINELEKVIAKY